MHSFALRKLIAPLLALLFALTLTPALAFSDELNVGGESGLTAGSITTMSDGSAIDSISFIPASPYVLTEAVGGEETVGYIESSDSGEEVYTTYFMYRWGAVHATGCFDVGDSLVVKMTDGSTKTYVFKDDSSFDRLFVNSDNDADVISGMDVELTTDQAPDKQWQIGTHSATVTYQGKTTTVSVVVQANPVSSITYTTDHVELERGVDGCISEDEFGKATFLFTAQPHDGDFLDVVKNGVNNRYIYTSSRDCFANQKDSSDTIATIELDFDLERNTDADDEANDGMEWPVGTELMVTVRYMGRAAKPYTVTVKENSVKSIAYQPVKALEYVEGVDATVVTSKWDSESNDYVDCDPWYDYNIWSMYNVGDALNVERRDGSIVKYIYGNIDKPDGTTVGGFISDDGKNIIQLSEFALSSTQDAMHWQAGSSYEITLSYHGQSTAIPVSIIANPVASIQYEYVGTTELVEGIDGWWNCSGEEWFCYSLLPCVGDTLIVNYSNGSTVYYECSEYEDESGSHLSYIAQDDSHELIPGGSVIFAITQTEDDSWKPGDTNRAFEVEYSGKTTSIPVKIKANPVTNIEYVLANNETSRTFIKHYDASTVIDENGDPYDYYSYNFSQPGDVLRVTYADQDDPVEFEYKCLDLGEGAGWDFFDADGSKLDGSLDTTDSQSDENRWGVGSSDMSITYSYMGHKAVVPVTLADSSVVSIEFKPVAEYSALQYTNGLWMGEGAEQWYCYNLPAGPEDDPSYRFNDGDVLKVHYGDEVETFTYQDGFFSSDRNNTLPNDGSRRCLFTTSSQGPDNEWEPGTYSFTLHYLGAETDINFTVVVNRTESISFSPASPWRVYEGVDCSQDEDSDADGVSRTYQRYSLPYFKEGDELTVVEDGAPTVYVYQYISEEDVDSAAIEGATESGSTFVSQTTPKKVLEGTVGIVDEQSFENEWTPAEGGWVTISYNGKTDRVHVSVTPVPVKELQYIPASTLIRGDSSWMTDGGEDEDGTVYGPWRYYDCPRNEGDKLIITDNNNVKTTYTCVYDEDRGLLYKSGSKTLDESDWSMYVDSNQSHDNQWSIGYANAKIRASYFGVYSAWVPVMVCQVVTLQEPAVDTLTYNGKAQTIASARTGYKLTGATQANAGTYTATAECQSGYIFDDGTTKQTFTWFIERAPINVPEGKTLTYNGKAQTGVAAGAGYTVKGGSATNADYYEATVTCDANHEFEWGGTVEEVYWSIRPAVIPVPKGKTLTYNGKSQIGVAAGTGYSVANGSASNANVYTAEVICDDNHIFKTGDNSAYVDWVIKPASIAKAVVTLKKASAAYTGKSQKGAVKSVKLGSTTLKASSYSVSAKSGKTVGSYAVTVKGKGNYTGSAKAVFKVTQAANSAKVAKTSVKSTLKLATVKKKVQKVALPKVTTKFGKAKWKVSAKDSKKVLTLKGNAIQVKKGAKKGTYTIKLKASVAKTKNYKAATTKLVTVKVTVK